jgi:hypothetical protein
MHAAPPLRVGLARSRGWILFIGALAGLAAANLIAWLLLHWQPSAVVIVAAALLVPAAAAMGGWLAWRSQAPLVLRWDGATWLCDDVPGDARFMLDLDTWLLLRFVPASDALPWLWIAAARKASDGTWAPLRSALYSRRPPAAPVAPSP